MARAPRKTQPSVKRFSVRQASLSAPGEARQDSEPALRSSPATADPIPMGGPDHQMISLLEPGDDALAVEEAGDGWLHVRWSLSEKTLARALSSMGRDGHRCSRVLRLSRVQLDDAGPRSRTHAGDIEVPNEACEWFLRVPSTSDAWAVDLGFCFGKGRFFSMLHSTPVTFNKVRTPGQNPERSLAGAALLNSMEGGAPPPLKVQGTFLLNGTTGPYAQMVIDDQNVPVMPGTGEFEWRLSLINGREVFPIVVSDSGKIQRALLAIEVNLRVLEPEVEDLD